MNAFWLGSETGANAAAIAVYAGAALVLILALALLATLLLRRRRRRKTVRRDNHRISVRDIIAVDERRRLILIRRDNVEHLLLTGGDSDVLVESFAEAERGGAKDLALFPAAEAEARRAHASGRGAEMRAADARMAENAYIAKPQRPPRPNGEPAEREHNAAAEAPRAAPPQSEAQAGRRPVPSYTPAARRPPAPAEAERRGGDGAGGREAHEQRAAEPYRGLSRDGGGAAESGSAAAESLPIMGRSAPNQDTAYKQGEMQKQSEQKFRREGAEASLSPAAAAQNFSPSPPERQRYEESDFAAARQAAQRNDGSRPQNGHNGVYPQNGFAPRENGFAPREMPHSQQAAESAAPARRAPQAGSDTAEERAASQPPRAFPGPENRRERDISPRPAAAEAYAPYLGYMPRMAPRAPASAYPAPQENSNHSRVSESGHSRLSENSGDSARAPGSGAYNGNDAPPFMRNGAQLARPAPQPARAQAKTAEKSGPDQWFEERSAGRPPHERSYAPAPERQGSAPERQGSAPERRAGNADGKDTGRMNSINPSSFGGAEPMRGSGFDLAPQSGRNGFSRVSPPEDNDFDKILQDELLRAPNTIKFPSSQKK